MQRNELIIRKILILLSSILIFNLFSCKDNANEEELSNLNNNTSSSTASSSSSSSISSSLISSSLSSSSALSSASSSFLPSSCSMPSSGSASSSAILMTINGSVSNENDGVMNFIVTISETNIVDISVSFFTTDNTAIVGNDYYSNCGTVIITQGMLSTIISINIINDNISESPETYNVNLFNQSTGTIIISSAIGTIIDDD